MDEVSSSMIILLDIYVQRYDNIHDSTLSSDSNMECHKMSIAFFIIINFDIK